MVAADGTETSEVCAPNGVEYLAPLTCSAAGCDAAVGRCEGDRCDIPIDVTPGTQYTGNTANFTAVSSGSCPETGGFSFTSTGRRAIHRVAGVTAGQVIRATAASPDSRNISVWVTGTCNMNNTLGACLSGRDDVFSGTGNEVVDFPVTTAGDYFIVVQSTSTGTLNGAYTLDVALLSQICTPGTATCVNNNMGSDVCAADGLTVLPTRTCPAGCDAATGFCNAPPGDRCDVPVDLTSGVAVTGNIADYDISHPQPSSCTGFAFGGRDGVWRLPNLTTGQRVQVSYTSTGFDGALYVSDTCTGTSIGVCRAGVDTAFSGGTETLIYTMPAAGDLLIVAGAYANTTNTGTFSLTATILP
jgi:hypothetical protein